MKKGITIALAALLCVGMLAGCVEQNSTPKTTNTALSATKKSKETNEVSVHENATDYTTDYTTDYNKLILYKTEEYSNQSVADFNNLLTRKNGDISELLEAHTNVVEHITSDDENYDFIMLTLAASIDELYGEQMADEVGFSDYVKKQARPIKALGGEELLPTEEQAYEFVFNGLYVIHYTINSPKVLTIGKRDTALQTFRTELQSYVEGLTEAELTSSNIKDTLSRKASELAENLSSEMLTISCEIGSIEVHSSGSETLQ